jgi:hypothetical protein
MRVESLLLASRALLSPHPMVSSDTASAARSVAHIRLANAFMQFSRLFGSIVFCFSFQEQLVECQSVGCYADESLAVEVANGTLEHLLAHLEASLDVFCVALVAQVALAAVILEVLQQRVGEVECLLSSGRLQRNVDLSVGTDGAC